MIIVSRVKILYEFFWIMKFAQQLLVHRRLWSLRVLVPSIAFLKILSRSVKSPDGKNMVCYMVVKPVWMEKYVKSIVILL